MKLYILQKIYFLFCNCLFLSNKIALTVADTFNEFIEPSIGIVANESQFLIVFL